MWSIPLNENNKTKLTEIYSQHQVEPVKKELNIEYVQLRKNSAWKRNEDDIEPPCGGEIATQPEFEETSL